jgi:hypothetical protein
MAVVDTLVSTELGEIHHWTVHLGCNEHGGSELPDPRTQQAGHTRVWPALVRLLERSCQ